MPEDTPIIDLTGGVSIDLAESAIAGPYRLSMHSDRARCLLEEGYPRAVVPFILRLEGRECTILDFTAARDLTDAEEAELHAIQRTLDELKALSKGNEPEPLPAPAQPHVEADSADWDGQPWDGQPWDGQPSGVEDALVRMEANGSVEPEDFFDHPEAVREYAARHGNRPPRTGHRQRYASEGHRLHALLGAHGVEDHYQAVSDIVGREVTSLNALSAREVALVDASYRAEVA